MYRRSIWELCRIVVNTIFFSQCNIFTLSCDGDYDEIRASDSSVVSFYETGDPRGQLYPKYNFAVPAGSSVDFAAAPSGQKLHDAVAVYVETSHRNDPVFGLKSSPLKNTWNSFQSTKSVHDGMEFFFSYFDTPQSVTGLVDTNGAVSNHVGELPFR